MEVAAELAVLGRLSGGSCIRTLAPRGVTVGIAVAGWCCCSCDCGSEADLTVPVETFKLGSRGLVSRAIGLRRSSGRVVAPGIRLKLALPDGGLRGEEDLDTGRGSTPTDFGGMKRQKATTTDRFMDSPEQIQAGGSTKQTRRGWHG